MKFIFIVTGFNCENYILKCYESLRSQTVEWEAIFISDGSTDKTDLLMNGINDRRISKQSFRENKGAAFRRYFAIKDLCKEEEDVICLLGMDDELFPNALEKVKEQYDKGKWMTYGNWIDSEGYKLPDFFNLEFPLVVHLERSYRSEVYRSTALNTFKKFLFSELKEEDFKVGGEWITATTESNIMFSCLEMCGQKRIGVIKDIIYIYNRRGSMSTVNYRGRNYQDFIYLNISSRGKKRLYEK
jgi:glycosyltransferase involved in cell wall biosynthesis